MTLLVAGGRSEDAAASAASAFHTPGKAVECVVPFSYVSGPPPFICWTPNDGFTVRMTPRGRVQKRYDRGNRGYHDYFAARVLLGFGREWSFGPDGRGIGPIDYRCSSRRTGLTCRNRAGHGWWLGRFRGYKIF